MADDTYRPRTVNIGRENRPPVLSRAFPLKKEVTEGYPKARVGAQETVP